MAELFSENRMPNEETAEEIIKRMEGRKNFIPSSEHARRQYSYVLLKEYRKYLKDQISKNK